MPEAEDADAPALFSEEGLAPATPGVVPAFAAVPAAPVVAVVPEVPVVPGRFAGDVFGAPEEVPLDVPVWRDPVWRAPALEPRFPWSGSEAVEGTPGGDFLVSV